MDRIATIILGLACCVLTACQDYLSLKSSNELAVPTELADLQALLDDHTYMNELRTPSYLQSASDEYFLPDAAYNALLPELKLLYQWQPFDYRHRNDWSQAYTPIYNANYCLETLDRIPRLNEQGPLWDNVYGSALFYRSYYFLQLLWAYAESYKPAGPNDGRGIVIKMSTDFNQRSVFADVEQSYQQVIADATRALQFLPDLPLRKTRPSKAAAHALLARAYLSMGLYENAGHHADETLRLSSEMIDYNTPGDGINITANNPFARFTKETIFYSESGQGFQAHSPTRALIDTALLSLYDAADLRRRAFFRPDNQYQRFKGTHSHSINWLFSGLSTSEVLLIRAESSVRRGDMDAGMNDLNALLIKRWDKNVPFVKKSANNLNDALSLVLEERRKELVMRGIRLSDIKRLNVEGRGIVLRRHIAGEVVTLEPNSERYQLAPPADLLPFLD